METSSRRHERYGPSHAPDSSAGRLRHHAAMSASGPYSIDLSDRFGQLAHIDVDAVAGEVTERWSNQTLTTVNDAVVRLGVLQGEFHWHKHAAEDEFFLVLSGELEI